MKKHSKQNNSWGKPITKEMQKVEIHSTYPL